MSDAQFLHAEQQVIINLIHGREVTITPEDLQSEKHRVILREARKLQDEGILPDLIGLHQRLKDKNLVEAAGGISYLTNLYSEGMPTSNLDPYERLVKEASVRKQVLDICKGIIYDAEEGRETDELLVRLQTQPGDITFKTRAENVLLQDVVVETVEHFINQAHTDSGVDGVPSGFKDLDEMTYGFQPNDLIVIAGRPSMGKTALATQICMNVARYSGPSFIASIEMDRSSLIERIISEISNVPAHNIRSRKFTKEQAELMREAALQLNDYHPVIINDTPRMSALECRMHMSQANAKYGLKLAMVDYLGLLKPDISKQRYLEIAESTRIMRATARELHIPVLLLSQLNRQVEQRDPKIPVLSDLRESGDIEQDSDVVLMLYRAEYYCENCLSGSICEEDHEGKANVFVRKQRKGRVGTITLTWDAEHTRFLNYYGGNDGRYEGEGHKMF
jgi:replicative DNA helicase